MMKLEVVNLKKAYGETVALNGINITLSNGIYGLLGHNGAGKSTLMNILSGNLSPDEGHVFFNGTNIKELGGNYRQKIGYMPQQQALYQKFTAKRFLAYVAALKGMSNAFAKSSITKVLEQVGLTEVAESKISTFSGGMKQRLLIAQAILDDPDILILDEPTAGLDPRQRIIIRNLILL